MDLESFEDILRQAREDYLRGSGERLTRIERSLNVLAENRIDVEALGDLRREFHGLAGSGTTHGFPQVTAIGLQGERECDSLLEERQSVSGTHLERWRALLDELRAEFSRASAAGATVPQASSSAASGAYDILLVHDGEDIQKLLRSSLEREGMSVQAASTKTEALAALKERIPDGMITDVHLLDGYGYEVVEHLRNLPGGEIPPVFMISTLAGFLDKVEAIRCGADGYFEKPVDWEALMRRLQHLLETRRIESPRILSVEDDPDQASFIRTVLQSAGYQVRICDDPRRFETEILSFHPDLVLLDIFLPGVDGYDLVRYIRQDERYAALPVLFLTTQGQVQARIKTFKAGGDEHLIKPVSPGLLLSAVSARIERSRFLKSLIDRDGLTRLLTHTAFLERAKIMVNQATRKVKESVAMVMIDLDHFKSINDRYGHMIGDRVLASLATLMRRRLRQSDTIGRYGGEEFAVVIENIQAQDSFRLVSRLLEEFSAIDHSTLEGSSFRATFSAGIAMLNAETMDLEGWKCAADNALYKAKAEGRNRVMLYSGDPR